MMDTKFSSSIHALILISESEMPMNSDQIAESVGTNPSYIRKLTTRLSKAGIIEGHRGVSGFRLLRKPGQISQLDIYKAVMETDTLHLFDIHQNPNDRCIVGHNIRPVLGGMFRGMEMDIESRMRDMTLADCITDMERYIEEHGKRKGTDIGLACGTYLNWLLVAKRLRRYTERTGSITLPEFSPTDMATAGIF